MTSKIATRPCPSCGGAMQRGVREGRVSFQGQSFVYMQPGWYCENDDDGVLDGPDNAYHDAALHEVMAKAKRSPISPLVVRAAREALGASQREAGRIFGGGPTAFHKYETGKAVPSEGMARLLRLAVEQPDVVKASLRRGGSQPAGDIELLRSSSVKEPLRALVHSLYPVGG